MCIRDSMGRVLMTTLKEQDLLRVNELLKSYLSTITKDTRDKASLCAREKEGYVICHDIMHKDNPRQCAIFIQAFYVCLKNKGCLLYTSPSPRDRQKSRMPSSA
eukprot:TRINITY_DN600_c0_g2_i16.p1 TRINITY_DN600_c0_g2~~TRINITY_DN600_c0_g2_i16.p1  ORF type:complete len:104 (+),score=7.72 TRINITY_DN600_c0_g2_i16:65-376(+)